MRKKGQIFGWWRKCQTKCEGLVKESYLQQLGKSQSPFWSGLVRVGPVWSSLVRLRRGERAGNGFGLERPRLEEQNYLISP